MKEPYSEGTANHTGPESCVGLPGGGRRSVDRGTCGLGIQPRNVTRFRGCRQIWTYLEGNIGPTAIARLARTPRGRRPHARAETPRTGIGRSRLWPGKMVLGPLKRNFVRS
jgi:hypothetical protein